MDREYSVFSILPPFNGVHAQVVEKRSTGPILLTSSTVDVTYDAVVDADGSINTTSLGGKTDFWDYADALFNANLHAGEGLTGLYMPQDHPTRPGAQNMMYNSANQWFSAEGIPITPTDDAMLTNTYPMMRIRAVSAASGRTRGSLDIVVPVATETDCQSCHVTGGIASFRAGVTWVVEPCEPAAWNV